MYDQNQYPNGDEPRYLPPHLRYNEPPPPRRKKTGTKIAAIAIACTILGGAAGGGVGAVIGYNLNDAPGQNITTDSIPVQTIAAADAVSIAQIYSKVNPAVVAISTEKTVYNAFGQRSPAAAAGSGFVYSSDGYVITNNHVIAGASKIKVMFPDGKNYDARIVGRDSISDLAVLKIDVSGLTAAVLGDSKAMHVGDQVIAIGNPLGELANTLTAGYLSGLDRSINIDGTPMNMLQFDAAINQGNSGGPLINMAGQVIGINSAKSAGNGIEGLGFAIPISDAKVVIEKLINDGYVAGRAALGISPEDFTAEMSRYYGLPQGAYIYRLEPDGAAAKAGLRADDIITAVDDKAIKNSDDLVAAIRAKSAGDKVRITYNRDKTENKVEVTLGEMPAESKYEDIPPDNSVNPGFGFGPDFGFSN